MRPILYQLNISLNFSDPLIWRQIQVSGATSLEDLHDILQVAMGWKNQQMHQFIIGDTIFSDADLGTSESRHDSSQTKIGDVLKRPKMSFIYEYDLSDGWEHEITVEKISPSTPEALSNTPFCINGANACPPEESGGIFGYYELLSIIKDVEHPAHQEMFEIYGSLNPEAFDLNFVNQRLKELFSLNPAAVS